MKELSERDKALIIDGIPESNLVGFYPALHGRGATLYDRSRYANHGTITGATWKRLPSGLWVLSFDGSGDVVNLGNDTSLRLSSAFSIFCWVKLTTPASNLGILSRRTTNDNWQFFTNATPKFGFTYWVAGVEKTWIGNSNGTLTAGVWAHLGIVKDATTYNLILNGVLDKTVTVTSVADTNATATTFGAINTGAFQSMNGQLALLTILKRGTLAAEWLQRYNRQRHLLGV